jgi:Ca-activated chloride channel family protein
MATGYLDNFYARLGIPQTATQDEIRAAYHQAARKFHPDHNKDRNAAEVFIQIQEAFDTLSDPLKRGKYNEELPKDLTTPKDILINAIYSRLTLTAMDRPQLLYVLLNILAAPNETNTQPNRQPLNICLVLDTSTSMSGSRLNAVKETAIKIIRSLGQDDILSVVTFNDRAEVIIPASRSQNINVLEARVSIISTGGGTEIGKGLELGYQELKLNYRPKYHNHIILITDGRTYGDEEFCMEIAAQAAGEDITIHTLGIGNEWNDDFLESLATVTGGSCEFAQTSNAIQRFLSEKFGRIQNTFATNVTLEFETPDMVELRYAFRFSPDTSSIPIGGSLILGDVPKQQGLSVLLEFLIRATPEEKTYFQVLDGNLRIMIPTAPIPDFSSRLTLSRPVTPDPRPEPPPQVLVRAMSRLSLYRLQEMAQKDLKAGNVRRATARLKNLATQLLSSGETGLAQTVMLELDNIRSSNDMSEDARKQIKYGTRALVLDSEQEETQS